MKKLILATALVSLGIWNLNAGTFQILSSCDGTMGSWPTYSRTVEAPYVGSLTLSYDATSALTNGSYAWSALSNLQLSIIFPNAVGGNDVTFNQSHLVGDPQGVYIQVVDGNFFFTNSAPDGDGYPGSWSSAANFVNGNYQFSPEPLNNLTRFDYRGVFVENAPIYALISGNIDPNTSQVVYGPQFQFILGGNYGNPADNVAVPEPSALFLLVLGLSGAIALRRVRR